MSYSREEVHQVYQAICVVMVCVLFGPKQFACSALDNRIIVFKEPVPNKVMEGHVISSEEVPSEGSCRVKCYLEPNCVSINMGPLEGGKLTCELNNSTGAGLKDEEGHTYLAIENPCNSSLCRNGCTCQTGFTGKGFRCNFIHSSIPCDYIAKSCSDLKRIYPAAESGVYVIDPDGEAGGLPPFNVTCDMIAKHGIGVTVISHDSENKTLVDGCDDRGCYSRDIHYTGATLAQLANLTGVSSHCEQFIRYDCFHARLRKHNLGWWVSRDGKKMTYWGGASPGSGKCACGMNSSCARKQEGCNCDRNDAKWREDSGLLTDKFTLPVTQLRFGDVGVTPDNNTDEIGYHTLGKFTCHGVV